jgi:drug/metabolite transporter (DMT)-like permease
VELATLFHVAEWFQHTATWNLGLVTSQVIQHLRIIAFECLDYYIMKERFLVQRRVAMLLAIVGVAMVLWSSKEGSAEEKGKDKEPIGSHFAPNMVTGFLAAVVMVISSVSATVTYDRAISWANGQSLWEFKKRIALISLLLACWLVLLSEDMRPDVRISAYGFLTGLNWKAFLRAFLSVSSDICVTLLKSRVDDFARCIATPIVVVILGFVQLFWHHMPINPTVRYSPRCFGVDVSLIETVHPRDSHRFVVINYVSRASSQDSCNAGK